MSGRLPGCALPRIVRVRRIVSEHEAGICSLRSPAPARPALPRKLGHRCRLAGLPRHTLGGSTMKRANARHRSPLSDHFGQRHSDPLGIFDGEPHVCPSGFRSLSTSAPSTSETDATSSRTHDPAIRASQPPGPRQEPAMRTVGRPPAPLAGPPTVARDARRGRKTPGPRARSSRPGLHRRRARPHEA